jgi:hypothetical protein
MMGCSVSGVAALQDIDASVASSVLRTAGAAVVASVALEPPVLSSAAVEAPLVASATPRAAAFGGGPVATSAAFAVAASIAFYLMKLQWY